MSHVLMLLLILINNLDLSVTWSTHQCWTSLRFSKFVFHCRVWLKLSHWTTLNFFETHLLHLGQIILYTFFMTFFQQVTQWYKRFRSRSSWINGLISKVASLFWIVNRNVALMVQVSTLWWVIPQITLRLWSHKSMSWSDIGFVVRSVALH